MRRFAAQSFEVGSAPSWPPAALRKSVVFRHWHTEGFGGLSQPGVLDAGRLDPGFVPASAAQIACLDAWRTTKVASVQGARLSLVFLSSATPAYVGVNDNDVVQVASVAKTGIMYPVVQLHHDLEVIVAQTHPANSAALFEAARNQWARDLVDAGTFADVVAARKWVNGKGPKLEQCATLEASGEVHLTPTLDDALTRMIRDSAGDARDTCIDLLQSGYLTSVLAQSGALSAYQPIQWNASTRAMATLLTLISRFKLVSITHSLWMLRLLQSAAAPGSVGTWMSYALNGHDRSWTKPVAANVRSFQSIVGKVGYIANPDDSWWASFKWIADASLVTKDADKLYAFTFALPPKRPFIRPRDVLPLIRSVHDCI